MTGAGVQPDSLQAAPRPSRRGGLALLAGVNALLLGGLWLCNLSSSATASAQPGIRPRGQYVMVSGQMQGLNHAIYILDVLNQELVAVRWDGNAQRLQGVGYRNIAEDAVAAGGAR